MSVGCFKEEAVDSQDTVKAKEAQMLGKMG